MAKAGYALNDESEFSIEITDNPLQGARVVVTVPPPKILSVELNPNIEIRSDNGWWNSITDTERAHVMNEFIAEFRTQMENDPQILTKAATSMQDSLKSLIYATIGSDTDIVFKSTADHMTEK